MSVTSIDKDLDGLTLTLIADFDAPAEAVWELWADPRKLERWWGPPGYPATFERHELAAGGEASYYMTGPDGKRYDGLWHVTAVEPPTSLDVTDGFAGEDGAPNDALPQTKMRMQLSEHDGGTRMELHSSFKSREDMDKLLEMGMDEGVGQAVGQMDALLDAA